MSGKISGKPELEMNLGSTRHRANTVLQIVAILIVCCLFLYQVSLALIRYLRHDIAISVELNMPEEIQFPSVIICPDQPFDPLIMKDLGLNIHVKEPYINNGHTSAAIRGNIRTFNGLNKSMSARDLWDVTAFNLGHLVKKLTFGNLTEQYNRSTVSSQYWHSMLTPIGTCQKLTLPTISNKVRDKLEVTIEIHKIVYDRGCPFYECNSKINFQATCNSTCHFETYLRDVMLMPYRIFLPKIINENQDSTDGASKEYMNNFLSKDHWQVARLGLDHEPLYVINVNSLIVEKHPLNCKGRLERNTDDYDSCVYKTIEEDLGCAPLNSEDNTTDLEEVCQTQQMHKLLDLSQEPDCPMHWRDQCEQKIWIHDVKYTSSSETLSTRAYEFHLTLTSPKVRRETETELYPFSQLASDFGGSLGLYLGLSVFSLLHITHLHPESFLPKPGKAGKTTDHCRHLTYWGIIASLTFLTSLHGLTFFQIYINQHVMTSVARQGRVNNYYHRNCSVSEDILDHVAARLASRALDCKPGPYSEEEDQFLTCLMEEALYQVGHVGPFVELRDLPMCSLKETLLPSDTYIVPSLAFTTATDPFLIKRCYHKCQIDPANFSLNSGALEELFVNHDYFRFTVPDLLCSLGGVVSLYAGIFLTEVVTLLINLLPSTTPLKILIHKILRWCLFFFIYFCGIILSIFLMYRFVMQHPISSSNSNRSFKVSDQPVLTLCRWPPFFKDSVENNYSLPLDEQWTMTSKDDIISRVAITQGTGTIVRTTDTFNISYILTQMNKCSTVSANLLFNNFMTIPYQWWQDYEGMFLSIHSLYDPPFINTLYMLNYTYEAIVLDVTPVHYTKLNQIGLSDTLRYSSCIFECIYDLYIEELDCKFPFITWRPDLPLCNIKNFESYPGWLRDPPDGPIAEKKYNSKICHEKCRHLIREFFVVQPTYEGWIEPNINILQERNTFMDIVEEDWYELSKLVNDLGVVVGFTLGTSILSFLQTVIQKWISC